jgi:hypothetical protein
MIGDLHAAVDLVGELFQEYYSLRSVVRRPSPRRFLEAWDDAAKQERNAWLEEHGLALVDFMAWKRAQDPSPRPPSRRKWLSAERLSELDEKLEGAPRW